MNRVSGPFGHAGNQKMSKLRSKIVSSLVSGAIPRNCSAATITIPTSATEKCNVIIGIVPFYKSVKDNNCVVSPPHTAIPRHDFVSKGSSVYKGMQCDTSYKRLLSIFTATIFQGAHILQHLSKNYPNFTTSQLAVVSTLAEEKELRVISTDHESIVDLKASKGSYSTVFDVTFGHTDSFRRDSPSVCQLEIGISTLQDSYIVRGNE